ncbi:MAG: hypothetical protein U9R38_02085 [Candidatus Margulisiibacteriota bacterium]|nr:hypothetical protein [Candidatus Margulisiibacteriota bacterium]
MRAISKLWKKLGKRLASVPKSSRRTNLINKSIQTIGKKPLPDQIMISTKALKYILGPADLSHFDVTYQFDGIN